MFDEFQKELKDLGMTPTQIKQAIADKKASDEKAAKLEGDMTKLTTDFEATKGEYATTKARLDELEANTRRVPDKKNDGEPAKKTSFLDDEDKAFNERLVEGLGPTTLMAFNAAKTAARMSARNALFGKTIKTPNGVISLSNLWDRWSSDIDKASEEMMKSNAAALQFERTWLNLFDYIKGQKIEDLMSKPETFIESVSSNTDRRVGDDKPSDKLDDEQSAIVKKMQRYGKGITPEKVLETRKKMTSVGA